MAATYDLPTVQAAIAARGVGCFTRSALDGIRRMGLTSAEALAVLAELTVDHFYTTMPAFNNPGLFRTYTGPPRLRTGLHEAHARPRQRSHLHLVQGALR